MIDVERTIISQYANSPTICSIISSINEWIDPRADIQAFYDYVWNVETAQGLGLDIWGKIVGISRYVNVDADTAYFGFDSGSSSSSLLGDGTTLGDSTVLSDAGASDSGGSGGFYPFGEAPFWDGGEAPTTTYALGDEAYRKLIMAKAMANITRCTAPAINKLLGFLFAGRGRCYVSDLGSMTMRYTFEFYLLPYEIVIVDQLGVLPRPAGVLQLASLIVVNSFFGFSEMGEYATPFSESPFYPEA